MEGLTNEQGATMVSSDAESSAWLRNRGYNPAEESWDRRAREAAEAAEDLRKAKLQSAFEAKAAAERANLREQAELAKYRSWQAPSEPESWTNWLRRYVLDEY